MKAADLTGQRFGMLVVTGRAGSSPAGNALWWCACDCGSTTRTAGSDLRNGRSGSCGCRSATATRSRHANARNPLTGMRFGRLTLLEHDGFNAQSRAVWKCLCDCGSTVRVTIHHLRSGSTVSCGCKVREKGPRPARWTAAPSYQNAHLRVKALSGPASAHQCVDCPKPAQDWSYDHSDPNEAHDERGRPFSTDPNHYEPRCRSCHRRLDSRMATARRVAQEGETA